MPADIDERDDLVDDWPWAPPDREEASAEVEQDAGLAGGTPDYPDLARSV